MSAAQARLFDAAWLADVVARLRANRPVRRVLVEDCRLHVERQLPFLAVYRQPARRPDPGTGQLVTSTASWLRAPAHARHHRRLATLMRSWADVMGEVFGATLLLELWTGEARGPDDEALDDRAPAFRILAPRGGRADRAVQALAEALGSVKILRRAAQVHVTYTARRAPPGRPAWMSAPEAAARRCFVVGLEVRPVHVDPETGELYPLVLRILRRLVGRALHKAFFEHSHSQTTHRPAHYHELGRGAISKAAREVDGRLARVGESFDFLLACTPVNTEDAWNRFRRARYAKIPVFHYRPLRVDPGRLKRDLFAIPVERVEDAALAALFRGKQAELDRQLTLLPDRRTPRFLPGALALYGLVEDDLLKLARRLLRHIPPGSRESGRGAALDAAAFARVAQTEFAHYAAMSRKFSSSVQIRDDLPSGPMVSHGQLLLGAGTRIPASRVEALVHHEIGTHVLTYVNGRAQPFRQLHVGLEGYDALQEGLAVMAEYLVGGLSPARMRLLAARVVAARTLQEGADFLETWRLLTERYGFARRAAFGVSLRVHRSGGLPKDAVYLRGLLQVHAHLAGGASLEPLFVGKIATEHLGIVRELTRRRILRRPPLKPRYLGLPGVAERIEAIRGGLGILDLAKKRTR